MAEQERGSDDPRLAAIARHALHDEELIAAYAADDVDDAADLDRARSLVERCSTCQELHRDIAQIRSAIRASGSAAERAATQTAPRDFRLTAADAARLRPGAPLARVAVRVGWRERLGLGIAAFGAPVGAALATLGVVGLLVGTLTFGGMPAAMSGAPAPTIAPGVDESGQGPKASAEGVSAGPGATGKGGGPGATNSDRAEATFGSERGQTGGPANPGLLLGGSVALLLVGGGLIVAARRGTQGRSSPPGN